MLTHQVTQLLMQARHTDPPARRAAVTGLGTLAARPTLDPVQVEAIAEAVITAAHDTDPTVRTRAARGLGRLPAARGSEALAALVIDGDHATREAAVRALAQLDPVTAQSVLVSAARHQDAAVRVAALTGLRRLPASGRSVAVLVAALSDDHHGVQGTAMAGLLAFTARDPRLASTVTGMAREGLGSDRPPLREICLELLYRLGVPGHRDRCLAALTDPHPRVRWRAVRGLEYAHA
ncbi:HEAT repeat domain-containing protein [Catellatospora sp. NPDC049111]|uniref:HEAT repeat domain-containing protein n=1 Tax=Catellatospora sp. NPDC049111 TaxID=3155271 RepID=UPI0033F873A5